VHDREAFSRSALASANIACLIILLGYATSAVVEQSALRLNESLIQISPSVKFLFSICSRDSPPCKKFKGSSPSTLSPSEAASHSLNELMQIVCTVSHHISLPSDYHSINCMESLWTRLFLLTGSDLSDAADSCSLPETKRHCLSTDTDPD
jgi:hypothetical protein